MNYEAFKALSFDERRHYIISCRQEGFNDRQIALSLGLTPDKVPMFYRLVERLGLQISKSTDRRQTETLCWNCKNACGRCSWSDHFEPVPGWEAVVVRQSSIQSTVKLSHIPDYRIISCPEFTKM